jgi:ABC-type phosphate transport system substrate-binding protein
MSIVNRTGWNLLALTLSLAAFSAGADVVAVVSSKSTVASLSKSQTADIFLGKASRFPNGLLAVPIDLPEESTEREEFYAKIAAKTPSQIKAYWSKIIFTGRGQPPRAVANDQAMKSYISAHPEAIGYIDATMVDDTVRVLQ